MLVVGNAVDTVEQVLVIPACAERDTLPYTLDALAANDRHERERTLVICVVNNRADCADERAGNNHATLDALRVRIESVSAPLRLAYVDASTSGNEIGPKEGVGAARKLGMDWAVEILRRNEVWPGLIISLDADTIVEANYLSALRAEFARPNAWAAVINYAHPIDGSPEQCAAILAYEIHLRYHTLGLRYAASPYAFHTVGSAMACTAEAYVTAGGMNRRQAGEDFYFLQELAKSGPVRRITSTTVHPSARASDRVPFGTGRRVRDYAAHPDDAYVTYHPASYDVLRAWLAAVRENLDATGAHLLVRGESIAPPLGAFLGGQKFAAAWDGLRRNAPDSQRRLAQFHRWFDGFRTLKMLHYLRDNGYPEQPLFEAVAVLLSRLQRSTPIAVSSIGRDDYDAQRRLLHFLRDPDRE